MELSCRIGVAGTVWDPFVRWCLAFVKPLSCVLGMAEGGALVARWRERFIAHRLPPFCSLTKWSPQQNTVWQRVRILLSSSWTLYVKCNQRGLANLSRQKSVYMWLAIITLNIRSHCLLYWNYQTNISHDETWDPFLKNMMKLEKCVVIISPLYQKGKRQLGRRDT